MAVPVVTCVGHSIVTGSQDLRFKSLSPAPDITYPTNVHYDVGLLSPTGLGSWGDPRQGDENNLE